MKTKFYRLVSVLLWLLVASALRNVTLNELIEATECEVERCNSFLDANSKVHTVEKRTVMIHLPIQR